MRTRTQSRVYSFIKVHRQAPIPLIAIDIVGGDFVCGGAGAGEGYGEFYADGGEREDFRLPLHGADEIGGGYDVDF